MNCLKVHKRKVRVSPLAVAMAALCAGTVSVSAASFTESVFATGAAVSATAPDSVTYANGSLWVEYGNRASSTDYSGKSTIVQYSMSGAVQYSTNLAGSVDGLKYDPNTGMLWALQNQDASSKLSIINPASKAISSFIYGAPYPSSSGTRGFDDVAFIGRNVYLSETNPAVASDPVVVKLNSATPISPLTFSTIQTGVGVTAADPDSLKSTPAGNLVLTGGSDSTLTFISNPGTTSRTARSIVLSGAGGVQIGSPDDSSYATATSGTFYVTDTTTNAVYAISASGLIPGTSLFVNVGNAFGSVDPSTGLVTPLITGSGLHGIEFVPSATATPEPSTFAAIGLGFGMLMLLRRRG